MELDQIIKTGLRRHLNLERTDKIPNQYLLVSSFFVALSGTLIIMPFDAIKTHLQKADLTTLTQRQLVRKVVQDHGLRGLFVGWRIRFAGYQIHSLLTINLVDSLEVRFRKINT